MNKKEAKIEALRGIVNMHEMIWEHICDTYDFNGGSIIDVIKEQDKISVELEIIIESLQKKIDKLQQNHKSNGN